MVGVQRDLHRRHQRVDQRATVTAHLHHMRARHDLAEAAKHHVGREHALRAGAQGARAVDRIGVVLVALLGRGHAHFREDAARGLDFLPCRLRGHQHHPPVAICSVLGGQDAGQRVEVAQVHAQNLHPGGSPHLVALVGQKRLHQHAALKFQFDSGVIPGFRVHHHAGAGLAHGQFLRRRLVLRGGRQRAKGAKGKGGQGQMKPSECHAELLLKWMRGGTMARRQARDQHQWAG